MSIITYQSPKRACRDESVCVHNSTWRVRGRRARGRHEPQPVTVRIVMRTLARTLAILIALLAATAAARAAEINAFVSTAIKTVTDELLPPFERASGITIRASYAPSGALIPRFERGEPVDVFLTDSAAIDALIRQGKIVAGRTDLARTGIGIAVRKGAPRPDVSSAEALRSALIAAK